MLATLFTLAVWLDVSEPARTRGATYILLDAYVAFAAILLVLTWKNWWLDAKLAGPAHALDIAVFTFLVFSTAGYTSPFFTFFMFVLLSAAIRWGWRATALTAVLVTILYLLAGQLVVRSTAEFELQRFMIGIGNLVILSLILIWFGINQWRSGANPRDEELLSDPSLDEAPVETSLRAAMSGLGAGSGTFVWTEHDAGHATALAIRDGALSATSTPGSAMTGKVDAPFLYDVHANHALARDDQRNLLRYTAGDLIRSEAASALGLTEGLAIPVRTGTGHGELFLERLPNLAIDHTDLGEQVAADVAAHIQRHALLKAVEEGAEARSRLSLARDLHDSVVQFLAGAAFRLEALRRNQSSGRDLGPELNELKQMMLHEQGELRSFIAALRSGSQIGLDDLANDLRALAGRLSRQWDVLCDFSAQTIDMMVPSRLHLDAQQLIREAVANAVRHAGAKSISIKLEAAPDELRLDFINDGERYPESPLTGEKPKSLSERVELAGGNLELSRGMGVTRISVSLPIGRSK